MITITLLGVAVVGVAGVWLLRSSQPSAEEMPDVDPKSVEEEVYGKLYERRSPDVSAAVSAEHSPGSQADRKRVRFALNEVRETEDQVVVLAHARGRAREAELDFPIGVVGTVRDGKIAEARMYSDPDEALEAAGLRR